MKNKKRHFQTLEYIDFLIEQVLLPKLYFGCHIDATEQQRPLNFESLVSD